MQDIFFYISLFIFGTLFGSFASVLIYRLHSGEKWILTGRSHCPKCNTTLQATDLIPIFSWLKTFWKCGYCKAKISPIYPFLEISTGLLFALVWYFLMDVQLLYTGNIYEWISLLFWLTIAFITILYIFYDILFLEIHEWMMAIWIACMILWVVAQMWIPELIIFDNLSNQMMSINHFAIWIAILIALLIGSYVIMTKELEYKYDLLIVGCLIAIVYYTQFYFNIYMSDFALTSWIVAAWSIFLFFFFQILVSWWAWLWGWDLRIALMIGLWLGMSLWFAWMMLTYLIGSCISLWYLCYQKFLSKNSKLETQIPFWPFLALGFFTAIFYQTEIQNLITIYF